MTAIRSSIGTQINTYIRSCTDTFVYFSHKCISLPPPGWIRAAHQHGVPILGTLIFEWDESKPKLKQLLDGPVPRRTKGIRSSLSTYYADQLIQVALAHGIDGFLVNVETPLDLTPSSNPILSQLERQHNARRLQKWVQYLRDTGLQRHPGWQVVWYDSVTYPDGQLTWQDALTPSNARFFTSSTSIFTNYTWAHPKRLDFEGFHPLLVLSAAMADSLSRPRSDVLVGIDVFGRNCYGKHDTYKALEMIGPHRVRLPATSNDMAQEGSALGLSVALFAQGWTWEHDAPPSRPWLAWWYEDCALWHQQHGGVSQYFPPRAHPWRGDATSQRWGFRSNFAVGAGTAWFVQGRNVFSSTHPWTDAGVSATKPHLAWPSVQYVLTPDVRRCDDRVETDLSMDDAWSGNTSLRISVHRPLWIPIVALAPLPEGADRCVTLHMIVKGEATAAAIYMDGHLYQGTTAPPEPLDHAWTLLTTSIAWPSHHDGDMHILLYAMSEVTVGQVDVSLSTGSDEPLEATWHDDTLQWPDFVPWCAYYELFALGDEATWLGTISATLARTQVTLLGDDHDTVLHIRSVGAGPHEDGALVMRA